VKQQMILGFGLALLCAGIAAQEPELVTTKPERSEATMSLQTTVTGNQEQPRVLYILPWQTPGDSVIEFESMHSLQEEAFAHIERDEFRRKLNAEAVLDQQILEQDEITP